MSLGNRKTDMKVYKKDVLLTDIIAEEQLSRLKQIIGINVSRPDELTPDMLAQVFGSMDEAEIESFADALESELYANQIRQIEDSLSLCKTISFCGAHAVNPLAFMGVAAMEAYDKVRQGNVQYEEQQRLKRSIRQIYSKMHSVDERKRSEGEIEFAKVMAAMSESEKIQFMKKCLEIIGNSKQIDIVADSVMNRNRMGRLTKCNIVVSDNVKLRNELKIADNHKLFVMLEKDGKKYPLKMSPVATVIYVMNLISRYNNKDDRYDVVNVYDNSLAFERIYMKVLNDKNEREVKQRLMTVLEENRLKEYYNEIENKLSYLLSQLGEEISPFIVNFDTPLVINKNNISLPEQLINEKINVVNIKNTEKIEDEKIQVTDE